MARLGDVAVSEATEKLPKVVVLGCLGTASTVWIECGGGHTWQAGQGPHSGCLLTTLEMTFWAYVASE